MKRFIITLAMVLLLSQNVYAGESYRINNQGNRPYCTAYAVVNAIETQMIRDGLTPPVNGFDEDWIIDNCQNERNRVTPSDTLEFAYNTGLKAVGDDETLYKITTYSAIEIAGNDTIINAVTSGSAVIIGTKCMKSDWKDGVIADKNTLEVTDLHVVYLCNNNGESIDGVNSWGKNWGNDGMFTMSYDYLCFPNILEAYTFSTK